MRVRQGSALGRLGVWGEGSPGFGVRKEGKKGGFHVRLIQHAARSAQHAARSAEAWVGFFRITD